MEDESAEKKAKIEDDYYVYLFKDFSGEDIYFGHETIKSPKC
jgi:hypothetical protein